MSNLEAVIDDYSLFRISWNTSITKIVRQPDYFTIYDFVDAHQRFLDPEWDGEPEDPVVCGRCNEDPCICEKGEPKPCAMCGEQPCICIQEPPTEYKKKVKVRLKNGKELTIQHTTQTMFWDTGGKPISSEEFLNNLFGELPNLFKSETELRELWSNPSTRRTLLEKLETAGYGTEELNALRKLVDAENSDLFDVLDFVFHKEIKPITRAERVAAAEATIFTLMNDKQKEFIEFVLSKYIEIGVVELDQTKLPILLSSMFQSQADGIEELGGDVGKIRDLFVEFQQYLYKTA